MTYEEVSAKKEAEKRTRWEANQRVKTEEKIKQELNTNSWAAKITKKMDPIVIAKMTEDEQKIQTEQAAKLAKKAEEKKIANQKRKEEYEKNYEPNMRRKYGVKEALVIPRISKWHEETYIYVGDFWEFYVENTRDDSELAKSRRKNTEIQIKFHAYLKEKYWVNWLIASEETQDDCPYLWEKRCKQRLDQEVEEYELNDHARKEWEEIQKRMEEEEKEEEEMKRKLECGEITKQQYNEWKWEHKAEDMDDDVAYQSLGLRIAEAMERNTIAEKEWKARRTNCK